MKYIRVREHVCENTCKSHSSKALTRESLMSVSALETASYTPVCKYPAEIGEFFPLSPEKLEDTSEWRSEVQLLLRQSILFDINIIRIGAIRKCSHLGCRILYRHHHYYCDNEGGLRLSWDF